MIYVYRNGQIVPRDDARRAGSTGSPAFAAPHVSRLVPYESPVTGKEISTWRERDAEMRAVDAYDPRDLPRDHRYSKGRDARKEAGYGRSEPAKLERFSR